jgi:PTS system galactitol-specific IIA component
MLVIDPSFMLLNHEASDAEAVIHALSERLFEYGAVKESYGEETIARERKHPTGLPTKPFAIAFPHAEAEGVEQSSLAVATLSSPVRFLNMGDPDEALDVEIVFLLANNAPEEQVQALRQLALIFSDTGKLLHLHNLDSKKLAAEWLRQELLQTE